MVTLAVAVVITSIASSTIQTRIDDPYTGNNGGIEEEMGILTQA